jgi:hypothetical protein
MITLNLTKFMLKMVFVNKIVTSVLELEFSSINVWWSLMPNHLLNLIYSSIQFLRELMLLLISNHLTRLTMELSLLIQMVWKCKKDRWNSFQLTTRSWMTSHNLIITWFLVTSIQLIPQLWWETTTSQTFKLQFWTIVLKLALLIWPTRLQLNWCSTVVFCRMILREYRSH